MKVAYIIPSLQAPSGWRTHAVRFLQAICRYVEPVLFVSARDLPAARELFPDRAMYSLPVTQFASLSNWRGRAGLAACWWATRKEGFPPVDLVHSLEAYPTGLVGGWLRRRFDCPHIITTHGTYGLVWHQQPLDRRVYAWVLKRASLVCPVSHGTARLMEQFFGPALRHTRLKPILNGNDFYRTVQAQEALERVPPEIPTLLTVGDLKPRKGQHLSLAAFARVKAQLPAARYFIAGSFGDGVYFQQLQQWVAEHQLRDVSFLGEVSGAELGELYRQASVFVLTPMQAGLHFEGFGLVYLEAGAYGLPVVATRTGGVPEAVLDGVTGFLAEPDDVDGLARALLRLLTDPGLASEMGRANRRWAETLTWERNAEEYFEAYREILERA